MKYTYNHHHFILTISLFNVTTTAVLLSKVWEAAGGRGRWKWCAFNRLNVLRAECRLPYQWQASGRPWIPCTQVGCLYTQGYFKFVCSFYFWWFFPSFAYSNQLKKQQNCMSQVLSIRKVSPEERSHIQDWEIFTSTLEAWDFPFSIMSLHRVRPLLILFWAIIPSPLCRFPGERGEVHTCRKS